MEPLWWHWIVLGIGLCIAELFLPSFFILWFGLGAVLTGLLVALLPSLSLTAQIFSWTLTSVVMTVVWFKVFKRGANDERTGQAAAALGEIGLLVAAVEPFQAGEVRFQRPVLGADRWPCRAESALAAGDRVKVVAVEGQMLKVAKL